jgi:hypothetical protein
MRTIGTPSATAAWVAAVVALGSPTALAAQAWNSEAALALSRRAIVRRSRTAADTALRDYKAQAHGFLFFLGQFGEGLTEPPRLIKADQLELEVYWKAPGLSKQRIIGWRDRAELPTDISYHRDHLGIIQNNFGAAMRLGEGDEVRDVPHPLAPGGLDLYDYALGDTTVIAFPQRQVQVVGLEVRPKSYDAPRIVGTLYLDAGTADLVRMAFNFTPRAYLDASLEDVSVALDNALWEGRFWLPFRQEIEIRRRAAWFDLPARGIIRGRWEIDGYVLNLGLARSWFAGEEITAVSKAERDSFPWAQRLEAAVQDVAEPVRRGDLERVRAEVQEIAGRHALSGLRARRLGVRGLSDLVHANRVEGLALGAGFVWRGGGEARELRTLASYGTADTRPKGELMVAERRGRATLEAGVYRAVRDVGDQPVIAPVLNSFASQELGDDYGDYYLATGARLTYRRRLGTRGEWSATLGREAIASLAVATEPATGTFRANPPLGGPGVDLVRLGVQRRSEGFAVRRDLALEATLEGGRLDGSGRTYVRLAAGGRALVPAGQTRLLARAQLGAASAALPPHRAFVLGGRGTLLGEAFRAWGGRRMALLHVEWRVPVPFASIALGSWARTPSRVTLAPYVATGCADQPVAGTPWAATRGARSTLGLALEWLGVFRLEAGVGAESGRARFAFDVTRDLWGIL